MRWIDKPRGMLLVEEDIPLRGGGACWTPSRTWPRGVQFKLKEDWLSLRKVKTAGECKVWKMQMKE